jgi:choline monooxygenase
VSQIYEVDADIRRASTLPASYYQDRDAFERSKDCYFANSWQFIGDTNLAKVPGQVFPFEVMPGLLNEPLLLTRDTDDKLHCISNVCTHRGMIVCEGAGNERFLRCRYHGRRFGLDGGFKSMPEFEDVCDFPSEADNLRAVPFHQWDPLLFASLSPAASFETVFGPILERLSWLPLHEFRHDPSTSRDYLVKAHWGLYVDNYLEGFHIPFVHTALNELLEYDNYNTYTYEWCSLQVAEAKSDEGIFDLPSSSPDFGKRIAAYYYWVFPNLMLNFYPWGLSINVIRPLGIDTTKVSFIRYVWDESKLGVGAGADIDRVEREDEQVVELVQKGLRSRFYDRGRFSPKREIGTHHFHRMLAEKLR